ncbi:hypothetical protein [Leptospira weilii]|uniref:hypothetical protein n=1 Tax=Leptospira weilii TaxID=28184 RepID=UPI0007740226|nr:hypothetical protein [Leptospira weilii]
MYSIFLIRLPFSETGLSAPVNKLKDTIDMKSITLSPNLLTTPPSHAAAIRRNNCASPVHSCFPKAAYIMAVSTSAFDSLLKIGIFHIS